MPALLVLLGRAGDDGCGKRQETAAAFETGLANLNTLEIATTLGDK